MQSHDKIMISAAKALLSRKPLASLRREGKMTESLGEAFDASFDLISALDRQDSTLDEIKKIVERKSAAAAQLKKMGIDWLL